MQLSTGPFTYNRFSVLDEKAKPDYLDFDKDGDKKEPMKKALKEKGKKPVSEKKELPDFIKKKVDENKSEKKSKKGDDCECDKKDMKEWAMELVAEGHDLSEFSYSTLLDMMEAYSNQTLNENRRAARAAGGYKDDSKKQTDPSKPGFTGISGSIKDIMRQNKEIEAKNKKLSEEQAVAFLMGEGYANNEVSASIIWTHAADAWKEAVTEAYEG